MTAATPRARLAAVAAAAGYPGTLLTRIAHATLPAYRPGDTLTDTQIEHVAVAVDTLLEAGHDADAVRALMGRYRDSTPDWRNALWRDVLRVANQRSAQSVPPASAGA